MTYSSRYCLSACTIAFIAGKARWLGNDAKLGFHSGAFAGMESGFAEQTLKPIGASREFIARASNTPSKDMWYPTIDELIANNIITGVATPDMFAMSGLGPNISREEIARELKAVPVFLAVAQTNQQVFDALIDIFRDSYVRGDTETDAQNRLRAKFLPYIRSLRPLADDPTLAEAEKLMTEQLIALRSKDPKLCFQYAAGTNPTMNFSYYLSPELTNRELALAVRIMTTANVANGTKPSDAQLRPFQKAIYQRLLTRFSKAKADVILKQSFSPADYAPYCDVSIAMFEEIARSVDPGRSLMIRNLFSQ